ncbi:MAG: ribulose-phosphate 3-epimerase [Deltaproteobacteria bacterium]
MALIAPSLLAADFSRLGEALEMVKSAGATMVHVDVADGHFSPDLTAGQPVIKSLRDATDLTLDVHLLIERPERYAGEFVDLGADWVSLHAEATTNLHPVLETIRARGAKAGVALNPSTPLEALDEVMGEVDFVTLLTADPGLKERAFIPGSLEKIRRAARVRDDRRLKFAIQVEGGVNLERVEEMVQAGADILVAGSAIFNNDSPRARLADMIRLAATARQASKV